MPNWDYLHCAQITTYVSTGFGVEDGLATCRVRQLGTFRSFQEIRDFGSRVSGDSFAIGDRGYRCLVTFFAATVLASFEPWFEDRSARRRTTRWIGPSSELGKPRTREHRDGGHVTVPTPSRWRRICPEASHQVWTGTATSMLSRLVAVCARPQSGIDQCSPLRMATIPSGSIPTS